MSFFIIQTTHLPDKTSVIQLSIEGCTVQNLCEQVNWMGDAKNHFCAYATLEDLDTISVIGMIPVGSLEFCEKVLQLTSVDKKQLSAIHIPEKLMTPEFTGRKIWLGEREDASELIGERGPLFVKQRNLCKGFCGVVSQNQIREIPDAPLLISEIADFVSEWRIFVLRGEIIDARPYSFTGWVAPDIISVKKMITTYSDSPPAMALDVAVNRAGETVIVEVHQFVACGFYGSESPRLLTMLSAAWNWELGAECTVADYFEKLQQGRGEVGSPK